MPVDAHQVAEIETIAQFFYLGSGENIFVVFQYSAKSLG
jgi:hypothetical protein